MKKVIYTILCVCLFAIAGNAQVNFGLGATYLNNLGVQARAEISLNSFNLEPKVSYYFVDNVTQLSFDVDATYNLVNFGDEYPLYVLAGPTLFRSSSSGFSNSDLGFNLGAGLGISHLRFEIKYTTIFCDNCNGQIGGNLAYMF